MNDRFDWDRARERLEQSRLALDEQLSPEQEQALLQERARALARPVAGDEPGDTRDVVCFTLCGERFAVDAEHVLEALPLGVPTPVPGTPSFLLGVVNHRGRVLGVMDLRRELVPEGNRGAELSEAVAVSVDGVTFAIAAETVQESTHVRVETLEQALVTVLDLEALAADPRLRIDDE